MSSLFFYYMNIKWSKTIQCLLFSLWFSRFVHFKMDLVKKCRFQFITHRELLFHRIASFSDSSGFPPFHRIVCYMCIEGAGGAREIPQWYYLQLPIALILAVLLVATNNRVLRDWKYWHCYFKANMVWLLTNFKHDSLVIISYAILLFLWYMRQTNHLKVPSVIQSLIPQYHKHDNFSWTKRFGTDKNFI